jgi:hypothetical protein
LFKGCRADDAFRKTYVSAIVDRVEGWDLGESARRLSFLMVG